VKSAVVVAAALVFCCGQARVALAQTLTGTVSSAAEGAMEGVLVSAQRAGSPITVTVVSDDHGRFRFPDGRLPAGDYALGIRAIGYDLDGPQAVELGTGTTDIAITLRQTTDLAAQLTNTEWFMSMPGTAQEKRPLIECMSCHTFERIVRSTYDAEALFPVLKRMATYANNTTQAHVQMRLAEREVHDDLVRKLAAYLATVNLSKGPTWSYVLQTLPRPKGRAIRVVVPGRRRQVRHEDQDVSSVSGPGRAQQRRHPAIHGDAVVLAHRRHGVEQRGRQAVDHAARSEHRAL